MDRHLSHNAVEQALLITAIAMALGIIINLVRPMPVPWNGTRAFEQLPHLRLDLAYDAIATGECLILDARPAEFYQQGHILNAVSLPLKSPDREVSKMLPKPLPYWEVIVYCEDEECDAADAMARRLKRMGYQDLFVLEGGWRAWSQAKLPTE